MTLQLPLLSLSLRAANEGADAKVAAKGGAAGCAATVVTEVE